MHQLAGSGSNKESAALAGVIFGLVDTLITVTAMLASHSSVLLADTCKTLLEFIAVLMAWLVIRRIKRGTTHGFDYGIGRLENISSLFVGILMIVCLLVIAGNAIRNVLQPSHIHGIGIWISAATQIVYAGINGNMCLKSRKMMAVEVSPIVASQARLFMTKAIANVFILASLILSVVLADFYWSQYIDPIASLLIGISILLAAIGILQSSFLDLLDRTLEEESQVFILRELARYFNEYEALHGVRSRRSGSHVFVEILLEFAADKTMGEVQEVVNRLRKSIQNAIQGSKVTIGLATEPAD